MIYVIDRKHPWFGKSVVDVYGKPFDARRHKYELEEEQSVDDAKRMVCLIDPSATAVIQKGINGWYVQQIRSDGFAVEDPQHRSVEAAVEWAAELFRAEA